MDIARGAVGMRTEIGTCGSGLLQNESEHRDLLRLEMNCQLEAVGKKRLHHQAHLVFGWVAFYLCMNLEVICGDPLGQMRQRGFGLLGRELIGKLDVYRERKISGEAAAGIPKRCE